MNLPLPHRMYRLLCTPIRDRDKPPALANGRGANPVWCHTEHIDQINTLMGLGRRVLVDGIANQVLITAPGVEPADEGHVALRPAPITLAEIEQFLDLWSPSLMIWAKGEVDPLVLGSLQRREIPAILIDAHDEGLGLSRGKWLPGLSRAVFRGFDRIVAAEPLSTRLMRRLGIAQGRVTVAGALDEGAGVLPCNERDRDDLARTLGTRQVWLAAGTARDELPTLIHAHSQALRRAHRLLLIVVPETLSDGPEVEQTFRAAGFATASRSAGQEPEDSVQVYIADSAGEMGLWYRLAPLTFMGATLAPGKSHSPFEPAALGSAVINGPLTDPFGSQYAHLSRAGAALNVRNQIDLAMAVESLLAPDKAALMAHAAWEVTSRGAEVSNLIVDHARSLVAGQEPA